MHDWSGSYCRKCGGLTIEDVMDALDDECLTETWGVMAERCLGGCGQTVSGLRQDSQR
jgi:hypothetical protein